MEKKVMSICVEVKKFIDSIGTMQTAWGLIVAGILIVVFICRVFSFTKGINKTTKTQIQRFQKEGKYLPSIYVELNNTMECLRYFIFSYRWKHRVIRQYNHLFHGYEGKRLRNLLDPSAKCRLSYRTTFPELNSALSVMHGQLDEIKKERRELYDKHGEIVWAITNSTYYHTYAIENLQTLCAMMHQKNVVLVGSAGNGKTNLMCRMAEVALANKIPCLLINSRDIKEDCAEYIIKKLPIPTKLRGWAYIYLKFVSFRLLLRRKYFYIFIDAINENNREVFVSSIANLLETFSKYSRIRILLTCRSEYFDSRYKALFSSCEVTPYIFTLQEATYDERATAKMINAYMDYFNVRGPFSLEMQNKLKNSLLLTRIFFEVNSNRDEWMLEFRNAEIYKLYFEKIASENTGVDLSAVVNRIAECMFAEFQFDGISVEELHLSSADLESLRNLLDNNLIISRSVHAGTGITEREEEYVYFVFDELRDFCLARYLLTLDENNTSKEYVSFFSNVEMLFAQKLSPVEGIIKYAYHHFRMTTRNDLCEKILNCFGESDVQNILERKNRGPRRQRRFDNYGISLIFSEGDNIASFEIDYILRCIEKDCSHYWEIFWFLLGNEYSGFRPDTQLSLDILMHCGNDAISVKILEYFFNDRTNGLYSYTDKNSRVDNLKEWLDAIKKKNGTLSANLKIIVTILAAYNPEKFSFEEYNDLVMKEEIFKRIQESNFCSSIKLHVSGFRDWMTPKRADPNALQILMEILKSEGYYDE